MRGTRSRVADAGARRSLVAIAMGVDCVPTPVRSVGSRYSAPGRPKSRGAGLQSGFLSQSSIVCCSAHWNGALNRCILLPSSEREEAMQDRFKFKSAPETLGLFAIVLVMIIFGAAIFYEGASFKQKRTAQFAVSDWNP